MKKILVLMLSIFLISGCGSKSMSKEDTMKDIIDKNNYIIVDVRTEEEYNSMHVKDAINIPYDVIEDGNLDKTKTIMVYCKSGARSNKAYNKLKDLGYDVFDLGSIDSLDLEKE